MSEQFTKQVIVIRRDLKMRRGKEIAQGSHASISFMCKRICSINMKTIFKLAIHMMVLKNPLLALFSTEEVAWMFGSFTKVCLQVETEQELLDIYSKAKESGLEVHLITDSGKTEFNGVPTNTCLAIGPHIAEKIDRITAHLKLY